MDEDDRGGSLSNIVESDPTGTGSTTEKLRYRYGGIYWGKLLFSPLPVETEKSVKKAGSSPIFRKRHSLQKLIKKIVFFKSTILLVFKAKPPEISPQTEVFCAKN